MSTTEAQGYGKLRAKRDLKIKLILLFPFIIHTNKIEDIECILLGIYLGSFRLFQMRAHIGRDRIVRDTDNGA